MGKKQRAAMKHPAFDVTDGQFQVVYDCLSFTFASMAASTLFFWLRLGSIHEKYKSALVITGLVTFIAAYHYLRIFESWVDAYEYPKITADANGNYEIGSPALTGELILEEDKLSQRWLYWALAMVPFVYIVYTLIIGMKGAVENDAIASEAVKSKIRVAQYMTVISWLTSPFVYIIPMFGAKGADAIVGIQVGYCVSDIISKCGVGLIVYTITNAKSEALGGGGGMAVTVNGAQYSADERGDRVMST